LIKKCLENVNKGALNGLVSFTAGEPGESNQDELAFLGNYPEEKCGKRYRLWK